VAHRIILAPPTDRGKAKIPKLKHMVGGKETTASINDEKSKALAKCFFPTKPKECDPGEEVKYLTVCKGVGRITREQIWDQLKKTKPFKAPGPDGIPTIILSSCADLLVDRLYFIYKAMLERGYLYKPWKISTTIILWKPEKPQYDVPKAYRPIALLNMLWKDLTAIMASHITHLTIMLQVGCWSPTWT
jgi:hypothetical protein